MPQQDSNTVYFPAYLHIIPIATFFVLFLAFSVQRWESPLTTLLGIMLIINIGVFIYQLYFLSKITEPRRVYKAERNLLIASLLILGSLVAGSIAGYHEFSDSADLPLSDTLIGVFVFYLFLLGVLASLLSLANVFYLYLPPINLLYAVGKLGIFVLWIAVLAISFFGYVIAYIIHDPSTE